MRALDRFKTGTGVAALAATLLLASPGVNVVRAEDAGVAGGAEQCSVDPPRATITELQAVISGLPHRNVVDRRHAEGAPEIVVLNNRGYNYGPNAAKDVDQAGASGAARR